MAWFERITGSSADLFLYNGMLWTFFNDDGPCRGKYCQKNAVQIATAASRLYVYGMNVKAVENVFVEEGEEEVVTEEKNQGGWGGVVAALLVG